MCFVCFETSICVHKNQWKEEIAYFRCFSFFLTEGKKLLLQGTTRHSKPRFRTNKHTHKVECNLAHLLLLILSFFFFYEVHRTIFLFVSR